MKINKKIIVAMCLASILSVGCGSISEENKPNERYENVKKEAEARLAELSVLGYEISPAFNKDTQEYFIEVPLTQENVTIDAKTLGSKAQIQGTGNYEVKEGNNIFEIVVTAENGETKTYKLNVAVVDKNLVLLFSFSRIT